MVKKKIECNYFHAKIGSLGIVKSCVTIGSIYDGKRLALFSLHRLPLIQA